MFINAKYNWKRANGVQIVTFEFTQNHKYLLCKELAPSYFWEFYKEFAPSYFWEFSRRNELEKFSFM